MIKVILAEFPVMIRPELFQGSMMRSVTASPHTKSLWILCVVLSVAAGADDTPCPNGGQIRQGTWRCYWLPEENSSWREAQDLCREIKGGDLASADTPELQNFVSHFFSVKTTAWVWLKGPSRDGSDGTRDVDPVGAAWWAGGRDSEGGCTQMALGTQGQWRRAPCGRQYPFLCEKDVTESLPSADSYLTGLVLMTGVYTQTQIRPLPHAPHLGQLTVELQLFPGMWFSHAGQLESVELVVQPSQVSALARVQILRPYCSPNQHLVPPGCSSLLNPFSCCSAVPLCNTTGGCSMGQYWCHLNEACVPTTSPCSPYDAATGARGFVLPPRYSAVPPFYHLVADMPLQIDPSSEFQTLSLLLPDRVIMVYPDDIVAIQHTRDSGTFLHCLSVEASLHSPWRQSYMSFRGAEWEGWWDGGLTSLPPGGRWVDGVVCNLRMMYTDRPHRGAEHEDNFGFSHSETPTGQDIMALTTGPPENSVSKFGLCVVHPVPDEKNQIHVQVNVPTMVVVKVLSGQNARSSWSAPVLETGIPFLPSCPEAVVDSLPDCRRQSHDVWFSSASLVLSSVGVHTLDISVMDAASSQSVSLTVCGYEAVTGLSVEPHGCHRILVDTPQSFTAKVKRGSSVKFTWMIDNLENFLHEGESYSTVFKKPADYKIKVTASNPVSSQNQHVLLTADELAPLAEPHFLSVWRAVAVGASHLYTIGVKVDISAPVTIRWDFGDGSSKVIQSKAAPCQKMEGLVQKGEKQVYVQDSVNFTYSVPDDYTLHVQVSSQHNKADLSMEISVRPQLKRLLIIASFTTVLVKQALDLEAFVEPSTYAVVFTWNFGDGSAAIQDSHPKVSHTFDSAGVYNVTVCANNTLKVLTTWLMVEVMEKISGLTVSCSGPTELSSATNFQATVVTGTSLMWNFDFGDGFLIRNHTDGSISHTYKSPGNYTVEITVLNSASQAHQSLNVEVYRLAVSGVLPTECVMSDRIVQLTALVNGNISVLAFHWLFGDGSPLTVVKGQSTVTHKFQTHGIFNISLSVFSSVTSASLNTSLCVEAVITNVMVQPSQEVVAVADGVCFSVSVFPEQRRGYQLKWFSSPSSFITATNNTKRCFVFKYEGVEEVSVMASNRVSNQTAKVSVTIQNPVKNLSVAHDCQSETLTVDTLASFWVVSYIGSNVSVLWDFGDGSPVERKQNVSHVFTSPGQFTVRATAFNAVSRDSTSLKVSVLVPVSDLSLHTDRPYAEVGEETLFSALSSAVSSTNYYWTVDGVNSTKQGTYQLRFAFPKTGVYRVRVIAQNLVSRKEADILFEVFERIEGLQLECQNLVDKKYVPAHDRLLFVATVAQGSNVTYQWLFTQSGINQQTTGDGEIFQVLAKTPGRFSIHLRASNKLGEITSVVSLLAVQRVKDAHFATQSNSVALGKVVNISVSVTAGSDLQYLWYLTSDQSPLLTQEPFILHTFKSVGHCLVKVSVQNILSHSNTTKEFIVQEEIREVNFDIGGKTPPFFIPTSAAVPFHGLIQKGSNLHWNWQVKGTTNRLNITKQTFVYSFQHAGTYWVSVNVSNEINWQAVSYNVTVQDAVEDLTLNISLPSSCVGEQVLFIPAISKGSNVSFVITFRSHDWIYSQDIPEGQYTTSSLLAGTHLVTVKAWNKVSSAKVNSSVLVSENIEGLQLVNCCSATLEALKEIQFKAEVQGALTVNFNWVFHTVGFEPIRLQGQEVIFAPPGSGLLFVSVLATNGVCSRMVNDTASVQSPVRKISIMCQSERIFVGHAVTFTTSVNGGSDLSFLWDFGDSTEVLVTDLSTVSHTYVISGKHRVTVKALNSVSHVSTELYMDVEELQCSSPQASILQSHSTIFRSRSNIFEASVDFKCSAYKNKYLWQIFQESGCTNSSLKSKVSFRSRVDATSPILLLPKHTLDLGQYCLVFTVSLQGTPLLVQRKKAISVVSSPLVAVIKGGSKRLWSSLGDLILDGSESQDPDASPGEEDTLQYEWTFITLNSPDSPSLRQPIGSNSNNITVPSTKMHPGEVYIFTLTVNKAGRGPVSVNQTVTVYQGPVLPVTVECVSCSFLSSPHQLVSHSAPIILSGQCNQCDGQAQYKWSVKDQSGMALDLNDIITSTKRHFPTLEVRSGVLQPGQRYTFTLNASEPDRERWGSASITILPSPPPHGGLCDLSPDTDIHLLETVVTYNCSGWQDNENTASQLIYTFQVAPCLPNDTMCPVLTLYRGTRSTFGSLLPMGQPWQKLDMSVITVTLLVEGHLGTKVIALNRMLTVKNAVRADAASQWLINKSQTELWALVQQGNPQEIIPYSIALTSQLNQLETPQDLMAKKEIRKNVTQALACLPLASVMDLDQISSALLQAMAVPSELVCGTCQENVIEAVGKMIHVMEEEKGPGILSAVETGKSILSIIGSSLAAASESFAASSSHSDNSNTVRTASSVTLSALAHASTLMHSLMRFHVHRETPVSLSTTYINTVGFQGDPSDLLCTNQGNQSNDDPFSQTQSSKASIPCKFHIPTSFTAHLKSLRSEVVQVLFGMEAELESNPLLTEANPPISTAVAAMELTSPEGKPIPIQDLHPDQAIRVTLPNKYPSGLHIGDGDKKINEAGNETCLTVTLPSDGSLNFTVKAVDGLDENAGLYISFNFSLDAGATPVSVGHVKIEVSCVDPGTNASRDSLVRECALTNSTVESIFLSPLLNGTDGPVSVRLSSSLVGGEPVRASVCVFSSLCQYYSVREGRWRSEGLQALEGSTLRAAHCLTRHLTMFGASVFVHPGAVVLLPPPDSPARNTVVPIVCAALVLIHLAVGLIAHKLDLLDSVRLRQVPLCGRPGPYSYRVLVKTGWRRGAGTTAHVGISLYGVNKSGSRHLQREGAFQRGSLDQFHLETDDNLGEVWKIRIWHDNTGLDPSWYVQHVVVWDPQTDNMFFFLLDDWLSVENHKSGTVEREVLASCPDELSRFQRVFASQLMFGMFERHLWLSLWECSADSCFTRGQRVTCSALTLHLYLALGVLWYAAVGAEGHNGPLSSRLLVSVEMVAVGMIVAVLVFPVQSFFCFLFSKAYSQVSVDASVPPSPICHSVEMDVHLGQSELSYPSFLSFPDSYGPDRDSPSSLLDSKAFDSSILDFWAVSGLAPRGERACQEEGVTTWPSYDSLLNLPAGPCLSNAAAAPDVFIPSPSLGPTRQLRRKKALTQLRLASPSSMDLPGGLPSTLYPYMLPKDLSSSDKSPDMVGQNGPAISTSVSKANTYNLPTLLTLSDEDLIMSITAAAEDAPHFTNSNTDSGRGSPRTSASLSHTSSSCSSWTEQSELKSLYGAQILGPDSQSCHSLDEAELDRCSSLLSVDSMASTFLPSPSPDSTRSPSTTRIGVARGQPGWLLPPWALCVIYPLVAMLLGACLAVVGLYGSFLSRGVVLMWLVSALSAFLTSALLLEPLKVFVQALFYTALWRPVDPEVEDRLAQETTVVRTFQEHGGKVRPPCGYGLLQAKEEARKVRALRSLMRHCFCQLLFLLLLLMVNYQDGVEQRQGRLLRSAVRRALHSAPRGLRNLTSLRDWSDAEQWIDHILAPHLHQNPSLRLVGSLRLRYTPTVSPQAGVPLGDSVVAKQLVLPDLNLAELGSKQFKTVSVDFTQHHRESGLFVCVSVQLERAQTRRVTPFLSVHPLLIPSSSSGLDLQVALTVLLLLSALLILAGELWSMATERAQYPYQGRHWLRLLFGFLSLATAILQFCFLSEASSCVSRLQSDPDSFINFHGAALLAQRSSQCAAVLVTLLVLKLLGTLRFVRRWVVLGKVLQRAWRELLCLTVLLMLLLVLCAHLGHTLFSRSVEGFASARQTGMSVLSVLRGRIALQRLCRVHPVLGPLYGLLLMGGSLWLLAKLCGAVLIRTYRTGQAELYRPTIEPQDYEMVEFFIKRLKLWMGITKAKEFRHRVKFEGMAIPPSRSSRDSCLSTLSSTLPTSHSPSTSSSLSSPRPLSSILSMASEDSSASEPGFNVQPYLDRLLPGVDAMLSGFDQVSQVTEEVHSLEMKLEEALARRRRKWIDNEDRRAKKVIESAKAKEIGGMEREVESTGCRKTTRLHANPRVSLPSSSSFTPSTLHSYPASRSIHPRTRCSFSESELEPLQPRVSCTNRTSDTAKLTSGIYGLIPTDSSGSGSFPRRRAWHCGSSHSADAAQRISLTLGGDFGNGGESFALARPRSEDGVRRLVSDGIPVKRKAWTAEGAETEHD